MICPCCNGTGTIDGLPKGSADATDTAIERYYRSRAAGSRRTLRQIAAETAYSYDYLRKMKRRYDAAGKWGSKTAKK